MKNRARLSTVAVVTILLLLSACGQDHNAVTRIDGEWHRRTLEGAHLSHWLNALPTANGFFNTTVNRQWQPVAQQTGDLVGHTRAIYVLAVGYQPTGKADYLTQVRLGADFLLENFRDRLHGGWYTAVAPDGTMKIGNKRLYGYAFAVFSLAHAYRATNDQRYLDAANQTWQEIQYHFADGSGGYNAAFNRDFSQLMVENTQNPIMHLFEAMLTLHKVSGSTMARDGANYLGNFVAHRLLQGLEDGSARIAERYDEKWQPLDQNHVGYIDIGHQFEWAYLFSAGEQAGLNPVFAGVANRLLDYGLAKGYDTSGSGVFASISAEGEMNRNKGYWQQAEALRAIMHHAVVRSRSDLWGRVTQMTELIDTEFLDKDNGGWFDAAASECRKGRCSERQPDGYHMTEMHGEANRLSKSAR